MARLDGVIRFKKRALDEERKILVDLEKKVAAVDSALEALEAEELRESANTALEVTTTELANYLHGVRYRRAALQADRLEKEEAAEEQRERVRLAFEELKTLEIADERQKAAAEKAFRQQEQAELDEIALRGK